MSDLNVAMTARKNAVEFFGNRCDSGHEHFLIVLCYCWNRSRELVGNESTTNGNRETKKEDQTTKSNIENYFQALSVEEDEDEEEHALRQKYSRLNYCTFLCWFMALQHLSQH